MSRLIFVLFSAILAQFCRSSSLRYADLGDSNVKKALCMSDYDSLENNCIPSALCKNLKQTQGWTVCMVTYPYLILNLTLALNLTLPLTQSNPY